MASSSYDSDLVLNKFEDLVECPACSRSLEDPRILPCHHSLCLRCLKPLVVDATGEEQGEVRENIPHLKCPICNQKAVVENGVGRLPPDFRAIKYLEILKEYRKTKVASDEALQRETKLSMTVLASPTPASCLLCDSVGRELVTLTCHHALCGRCVGLLLPAGGVKLRCPTCKAESAVTKEGGPARDDVKEAVHLDQSKYSSMGELRSVFSELLKRVPKLPITSAVYKVTHVSENALSPTSPSQPPSLSSPLPSSPEAAPPSGHHTRPNPAPRRRNFRSMARPMQVGKPVRIEISLSDIMEKRRSLRKTSFLNIRY